MNGWRWNPRLAAVCLGLFLVIQLSIPTVRLLIEHDRAERFAWQMFTFATAFEFTVITADGEQEVDLEDVLARPRADMPIEELVPPHLCATVDGAIRVVWQDGELEC
jgi:hypothetical protein